MKILGYLLLAGMTLLGLPAIFGVLSGGHDAVNTTQHVPWGLWVAFYIFFLGLSAGSFLLSTLVYVFGVKRLEPVGPLALLQAILCLVLGGMLIILDLGHPERALLVLTSMNPTSVMGWMGIFYNVYIIVVLVELYLAIRPRLVERAKTSGFYRALTLGNLRTDPESLATDARWLKRLGILGIPVALIVHGGVGCIFAVAKARAGWFGGVFPIVFIISALASGGAFLAFLTAAFSKLELEKKTLLVRDLVLLSLGILCFDWLILSSEILTTLYGNVPHEANAWKLILYGPYSVVFWILQLGVGFLLPVLICINRAMRSNVHAMGLAGFLIVAGIVGARLNLVIPAQILPAFPSLTEVYHHARWAYGYSPSNQEWLVGLGAVAIGFWLFLIAKKLLPLEENS